MPQATGRVRFDPEDVIVGILAHLASDKDGEKLPAGAAGLHKAVAELKGNERFGTLLRGLAFDRRDYFPYSETLEETLDVLQLGGYLERTNPRGLYYLVRPSLAAMFDKEIRQKFAPEELQLIEEATADFRRAVRA